MLFDTGPDAVKDCGRIAALGSTLDMIFDDDGFPVDFRVIDEEGAWDVEAYRRIWARWTN